MLKARVDKNQSEIVNAFRIMGCTVMSLATIGKGCPDILVGYQGKNYLFEIKYEKGKTNDLQKKFISSWAGQVKVINSVDFVTRFIQDPERWGKLETIQQLKKGLK